MDKEVSSKLALVIRKNSIFLLGQKAIAPIFNLLITVYIIRKLSIEAFGIYGVLGTLMDYIMLFSALGLPSIYQRFLPEFLTRKEERKAKYLINRGFCWSLAAGIGFIIIVLIFSEKIGLLLKIKNYLGYFILWSPGTLLCLEAELLGIALTSLFIIKHYAIGQVGYQIFRCAMVFYLLKIGLDIKGLILAEVLSYGFIFIFLSYFYRRNFSRDVHTQGEVEINVKRMVRYGGFSYFNEMGAKVLDASSDLIIISAFLGPGAAGIYSFANRLISQVSMVMPDRVFQEVIRPAFFSKYISDNTHKTLESLANMLVKFFAFFIIPAIIGIMTLGDKIIMYVFDPKYLSSLSVLWIVAGFTALNCFQFPLGMIVQAIEKPEINFYSKVFSLYNIAGNLLVVNSFGIVGIAIVTGTAVLFKNLFIYRLAKKHVAFSLDLRSVARIVVNSGIMGILVWGLRGIAVNLMSLMAVVLIGGITYFLISFLNKSFSLKEREVINKILPRPVFIF